MEEYKPKIVALFAGCGGLDLGFEKAGFQFHKDMPPAAFGTFMVASRSENRKG